MRHTVRLHGVIVGHSELEHVDTGVSRAWGAFRPSLGYDLVQPVFRLFADAVPYDGSARDEAQLERYYKARDALQLELQEARGAPIRTTAIHIADYREQKGSAALELDVLIDDDAYWRQRAADKGGAPTRLS
jgi:hypothetical protein